MARLKREQVLDFVVSRGFQPFTTTCVAEALGAKECAARAAVSWLALGGYIRTVGWHTTRDHVKLYTWTGKHVKTGTVPIVRRAREEREYVQRCEKYTADALQDVLNMMVRR